MNHKQKKYLYYWNHSIKVSLVSSKLCLNSSNTIDADVIDSPRLCFFNLSGDKLSIALIVEVVSPKKLVDFKLFLNGSNNIYAVFVYYPRLCGSDLSVDRLSTVLMVEVISKKYYSVLKSTQMIPII